MCTRLTTYKVQHTTENYLTKEDVINFPEVNLKMTHVLKSSDSLKQVFNFALSKEKYAWYKWKLETMKQN